MDIVFAKSLSLKTLQVPYINWFLICNIPTKGDIKSWEFFIAIVHCFSYCLVLQYPVCFPYFFLYPYYLNGCCALLKFVKPWENWKNSTVRVCIFFTESPSVDILAYWLGLCKISSPITWNMCSRNLWCKELCVKNLGAHEKIGYKAQASKTFVSDTVGKNTNLIQMLAYVKWLRST